jgi:hypothetical protein
MGRDRGRSEIWRIGVLLLAVSPHDASRGNSNHRSSTLCTRVEKPRRRNVDLQEIFSRTGVSIASALQFLIERIERKRFGSTPRFANLEMFRIISA